jgi:hypothetical protein
MKMSWFRGIIFGGILAAFGSGPALSQTPTLTISGTAATSTNVTTEPGFDATGYFATLTVGDLASALATASVAVTANYGGTQKMVIDSPLDLLNGVTISAGSVHSLSLVSSGTISGAAGYISIRPDSGSTGVLSLTADAVSLGFTSQGFTSLDVRSNDGIGGRIEISTQHDVTTGALVGGPVTVHSEVGLVRVGNGMLDNYFSGVVTLGGDVTLVSEQGSVRVEGFGVIAGYDPSIADGVQATGNVRIEAGQDVDLGSGVISARGAQRGGIVAISGGSISGSVAWIDVRPTNSTAARGSIEIIAQQDIDAGAMVGGAVTLTSYGSGTVSLGKGTASDGFLGVVTLGGDVTVNAPGAVVRVEGYGVVAGYDSGMAPGVQTSGDVSIVGGWNVLIDAPISARGLLHGGVVTISGTNIAGSEQGGSIDVRPVGPASEGGSIEISALQDIYAGALVGGAVTLTSQEGTVYVGRGSTLDNKFFGVVTLGGDVMLTAETGSVHVEGYGVTAGYDPMMAPDVQGSGNVSVDAPQGVFINAPISARGVQSGGTVSIVTMGSVSSSEPGGSIDVRSANGDGLIEISAQQDVYAGALVGGMVNVFGSRQVHVGQGTTREGNFAGVVTLGGDVTLTGDLIYVEGFGVAAGYEPLMAPDVQVSGNVTIEAGHGVFIDAPVSAAGLESGGIVSVVSGSITFGPDGSIDVGSAGSPFGGQIELSAERDIFTGALVGGMVTVTSQTGAVYAGNGLTPDGNFGGVVTLGGDVRLTATTGSVSVEGFGVVAGYDPLMAPDVPYSGNVWIYSGQGVSIDALISARGMQDGGNVSIDAPAISHLGPNGWIDVRRADERFASGMIELSAEQDIFTPALVGGTVVVISQSGAVHAGGGLTPDGQFGGVVTLGGDVTLIAHNGSVHVVGYGVAAGDDPLMAPGVRFSGTVSIGAAQDVSVDAPISARGMLNSGNVTISAGTTLFIGPDGYIDVRSADQRYAGGNIELSAGQDILIGALAGGTVLVTSQNGAVTVGAGSAPGNIYGVVTLGRDVTLIANGGSVQVEGYGVAAGYDPVMAPDVRSSGNVSIGAVQDVSINAPISARGVVGHGNVTISAGTTLDFRSHGWIDVSSAEQRYLGGTIELSAAQGIFTGALVGGTVMVTSQSGTVSAGWGSTPDNNYSGVMTLGGDVMLTANGGSVQVEAFGVTAGYDPVTAPDVQSSGNVSIGAVQDVSIDAPISARGLQNSGMVSISAGRELNFGPEGWIDVRLAGLPSVGGSIDLYAQQDISAGALVGGPVTVRSQSGHLHVGQGATPDGNLFGVMTLGGQVTLTANEASAHVEGFGVVAGYDPLIAPDVQYSGTVNVAAGRDVFLKAPISARGVQGGGMVSIYAGRSIVGSGPFDSIDVRSVGQQWYAGGWIDLYAQQDIFAGALVGGSVTADSQHGAVHVGEGTTPDGNYFGVITVGGEVRLIAHEGSVYVEGYGVVAGYDPIMAPDVQYSGTVTIGAAQDVSIDAPISARGVENSGLVSISAGRNLGFGTNGWIDVRSIGPWSGGGVIDLTAQGDIYTGALVGAVVTTVTSQHGAVHVGQGTNTPDGSFLGVVSLGGEVVLSSHLASVHVEGFGVTAGYDPVMAPDVQVSGGVRIDAGQDVFIDAPISARGAQGGGNVTIIAGTALVAGTLAFGPDGWIDVRSAAPEYAGGLIDLSAQGDIHTGALVGGSVTTVTSQHGAVHVGQGANTPNGSFLGVVSLGGEIVLSSHLGSVHVEGFGVTAGYDPEMAPDVQVSGGVRIDAGQDVFIDAPISARGAQGGGNVTIIAGTALVAGTLAFGPDGWIDVRSLDPAFAGGLIDLSAQDDIYTGALVGGSVTTVNSSSGSVHVGQGATPGGSFRGVVSLGGEIVLSSHLGSVHVEGFGVTAGYDPVMAPDVQVSGGVRIDAGQDVFIDSPISARGAQGGGNVTILAGTALVAGTLAFGPDGWIDVRAAEQWPSGGTIDLSAQQDIYTGALVGGTVSVTSQHGSVYAGSGSTPDAILSGVVSMGGDVSLTANDGSVRVEGHGVVAGFDPERAPNAAFSGTVSISAGQDVFIDAPISARGVEGGVVLASAGRTLTFGPDGWIDASSTEPSDVGGYIDLSAQQDIFTGALRGGAVWAASQHGSVYAGNGLTPDRSFSGVMAPGGDVRLTALEGSVHVEGFGVNAGFDALTAPLVDLAGSVWITAGQDVFIDAPISARGLYEGGAVTVGGQTINFGPNAWIDVGTAEGFEWGGGTIELYGRDITAGALVGGGVAILAQNELHAGQGATPDGRFRGVVTMGHHVSLEATAGSVYVEGFGVSAGYDPLMAPDLLGSGNISIKAAQDVYITAPLSTRGPQLGGNISIEAVHGDVHALASIDAHSEYGPETSGLIDIKAAGTATVRDLKSSWIAVTAGVAINVVGDGNPVEIGTGDGKLSFTAPAVTFDAQTTLKPGAEGTEINTGIAGTGEAVFERVHIVGNDILNEGAIILRENSTLRTTGNYTQNASGSLDAGILQHSPVLTIEGAASLAGQFKTSVPTASTITAGEIFTPMVFGSVSGNFDEYVGLRFKQGDADWVLRPTLEASSLELIAELLQQGFAAGVTEQVVPAGATVSVGDVAGVLSGSTVPDGLGTQVAILQAGFASVDVTLDFVSSGNFSAALGGTIASDVLELHGMDFTSSDKFVLQLDYDEELVIQALGSENAMFLAWFDPSAGGGLGAWVNAVFGNTGAGNNPFKFYGAYDENTMFALGNYGVDTVANRVWAVIDHNSKFGAAGIIPIPEPASSGLIGIGFIALFGCRRRRARR